MPSPAAAGADFATCDPNTNLNATPANNGGTGTWSVGNALYYETFPTADNGLGVTGPTGATTFTHPNGNWNIVVPAAASLTAATDYIRVENGVMEVRDVDGEVEWRSAIIPITAIPNITISLQ
ncbi:hypothetical protein QQ054_00295 [Oscillatoria amoena NRMC-F 0135]|nr:hypothetical protein [Oscillatoria amoena NRMC-F 0135]